MSLLIIILIGVLLYLYWPTIQAWLAVKLLQRLQRRMTEATGGEAYRNRGYGAPGASSERREGTTEGSDSRQKQELDDIEARKFTRPSSDEYVDFEELPRD